VYCGPHHSSLWEEENRKYGNLFKDNDPYSVKNSQGNLNYDKMVADLWLYLAANNRYLTLRRFHILGGEPFLLKELDESINFWDTHGNPDLVFSIITNLNIPTARFQQYLDRFEHLVKQNKIWKFQITASLDGWGPEEEYVRYGLNLETWERNFKLILDKPWITASINSAVSSLSIKQLPALVNKMKEWNNLRPVDSEPIVFSFNYTTNHTNPLMFGKGVFDEDFSLALSLLDKKSKSQIGIYQALESIGTTISSSTRNLENINGLKKYLDQIDQRRKLDWRKTFPWLDQEFK
jgi:hypothetical protein